MSYNTRNKRLQGGSTWEIEGDVNVITSGAIKIQTGTFQLDDSGTFTVTDGAAIGYASGGYYTVALTSNTSDLSPLVIGAINEVNPSSGIAVVLPAPAVGAECWVLPTANAVTTGRLSVASNAISTDATYVIGTATGTSPFENTITYVWSTGAGMLGFKGLSATQWMLTDDVAGISFGSTLQNTTA